MASATDAMFFRRSMTDRFRSFIVGIVQKVTLPNGAFIQNDADYRFIERRGPMCDSFPGD